MSTQEAPTSGTRCPLPEDGQKQATITHSEPVDQQVPSVANPPQLPSDVIAQILSVAKPEKCSESTVLNDWVNDLVRYIRISSTWRDAGERSLYHTISFDIPEDYAEEEDKKKFTQRAEILLRTLREDKHLAGLVCEIDLSQRDSEAPTILEELSIISDIIKECNNLQRFVMDYDCTFKVNGLKSPLVHAKKLEMLAACQPRRGCLFDAKSLSRAIKGWSNIREISLRHCLISSIAVNMADFDITEDKYELAEVEQDEFIADAVFLRALPSMWPSPITQLCVTIKNDEETFHAFDGVLTALSSNLQVLGVRLWCDRYTVPVLPGYFSDAVSKLNNLQVLIMTSTLVKPSALRIITSLRYLHYFPNNFEDRLMFALNLIGRLDKRGLSGFSLPELAGGEVDKALMVSYLRPIHNEIKAKIQLEEDSSEGDPDPRAEEKPKRKKEVYTGGYLPNLKTLCVISPFGKSVLEEIKIQERSCELRKCAILRTSQY